MLTCLLFKYRVERYNNVVKYDYQKPGYRKGNNAKPLVQDQGIGRLSRQRERTTPWKSINHDHTIVFMDKSTFYVNIANYVKLHISEKSNEQTTRDSLKWVCITISNAKGSFTGTYHKIK